MERWWLSTRDFTPDPLPVHYLRQRLVNTTKDSDNEVVQVHGALLSLLATISEEDTPYVLDPFFYKYLHIALARCGVARAGATAEIPLARTSDA
jgi:hypothetical protein